MKKALSQLLAFGIMAETFGIMDVNYGKGGSKRPDNERLAIMEREAALSKENTVKLTPKPRKKHKVKFTYEYRKGDAVINGVEIYSKLKKGRAVK